MNIHEGLAILSILTSKLNNNYFIPSFIPSLLSNSFRYTFSLYFYKKIEDVRGEHYSLPIPKSTNLTVYGFTPIFPPAKMERVSKTSLSSSGSHPLFTPTPTLSLLHIQFHPLDRYIALSTLQRSFRILSLPFTNQIELHCQITIKE